MWPVLIFVLTVIILVIYNNIINVIPVIIFPYVYSVSFIFKNDVESILAERTNMPGLIIGSAMFVLLFIFI
jgi:hypothetical protein